MNLEEIINSSHSGLLLREKFSYIFILIDNIIDIPICEKIMKDFSNNKIILSNYLKQRIKKEVKAGQEIIIELSKHNERVSKVESCRKGRAKELGVQVFRKNLISLTEENHASKISKNTPTR